MYKLDYTYTRIIRAVLINFMAIYSQSHKWPETED